MPLQAMLLNALLFGVALIGVCCQQSFAAEADSHLLSLGEPLQGITVGTKEQMVLVTSETLGARLFGAGQKSDCLEIDVQEALQHFTFKPLFEGLGDGISSVWVRIAKQNETHTVCQTGQCFGTFKLTSDSSGAFTAAEPNRALLSHSAIELIDRSNFSICIGVTGSAAGSISAKALPARSCYRAPSCSEPPMNISGHWKSNYSCTDSCEGVQDEEMLRIHIVQDPKDLSKASYSDSQGGRYKGTVCGNTFEFTGGGVDWIERGKFVFDSTEEATKTSNYSHHKTCCVGSCSDKLVRDTEAKQG